MRNKKGEGSKGWKVTMFIKIPVCIFPRFSCNYKIDLGPLIYLVLKEAMEIPHEIILIISPSCGDGMIFNFYPPMSLSHP